MMHNTVAKSTWTAELTFSSTKRLKTLYEVRKFGIKQVDKPGANLGGGMQGMRPPL